MEIKIKVNPGSGRSRVVKKHEMLVVYTKSEAASSRANHEMIELLSKHFKLDSTKIKIVSGVKSQMKKVSIDEY